MVSLCASRLGATQPMGSAGGGMGVGAVQYSRKSGNTVWQGGGG